MSLTLIMPCAGKSTRFNQTKPKWMLTHPNGNLMIMESLFGLDLSNVSRLIITVVRSHIEGSRLGLDRVSSKIKQQTGLEPEFLVLEDFTSSQSETVYKTLIEKSVSGPFFVKDCDNFFHTPVSDKNTVCVSFLTGKINAVNKSYVTLDKFGFISSIVEKTVVGDRFCVGGYGFSDTEVFKQTFEKLSAHPAITVKEIYLSHIIQDMIFNSQNFEIQDVNDYEDWGTMEDWEKYTAQFNTIFIDLDGVLVVNGGEYTQPYWGEAAGLANNIAMINKLYDSGKSTIIITTSRKEEYREQTYQQLQAMGIKYHQVIFGLPHGKRILINDYANSNPYPTAISINLKRNSDELETLFKR